MHTTRVTIALVALLLLATPALAHVPTFPEGNTTPERAVDVPDAAKSWSFYDRLAPGEVRYYRFSLAAGERLRVGTFTPSASGFTPGFVLMSPAIEGADAVPDGVVVPDGMGATVVPGERPGSPSYEPFGPSANYHTADLDQPVTRDTTYLLAVYEPADRAGQVGVALGYREQFSLVEYLTVPFDLVQTHLWEGQSPVLVYGPWAVTLLGGVALAWRRRATGLARPFARWVGVAALLVVGTGVSAALQMGLALSKTGLTPGTLVTAAFVVVPLVGGGWVAWRLRDGLPPTLGTRVGLALVGVTALVTWAGFVVAPAVVLVAAVAPARFLDPRPDDGTTPFGRRAHGTGDRN
jgi:hypothetical protein